MHLYQISSKLLGDTVGKMNDNLTSVVLAASVITLTLGYMSKVLLKQSQKYPPYIPSSIPFLGHAIAFGKSPIEFLENAYEKYGPVFSFTMVGKTFTYLLGSEAASLMFNSKNEDLNAEDVYSRLTTPVFGKGVAYDVPNPIFLEQKKMLKTGLNIAHFKQHVRIIEAETREYFERWGDSGERNLFEALSELIILTASSCLHGKEIRSMLDERVAQLYADLDGGFSHAAWLLPGWLPLPSFRRKCIRYQRDRAHREIKNIFFKDDILQTLIDATYKDGHPLNDNEIAGMLIGLLLAGQHTSSTTSAWMGFFMARDKALQKRCYAEQKTVCGEDLPPLDFDQLKDLSLLERCLKETLRLRPPIMTMMRMARSPQTAAGYTIPVGHQVCVSPTVNHRLSDTWAERMEFNPDRYLNDNPAAGEKFAYVPFGAGRHRCIGENFAYVQIKTIWSTMLRLYDFDLVDGYFPTINYTTMIHTPHNPIIRYKRRKQ
uniref:Lanosterol 14-alpha demethylase n=1 Tax=Myripristis murdjan TaxID=586833 RepID=A0A667WQ04_9TELE